MKALSLVLALCLVAATVVAAPSQGLTKVTKRSLVCMVNDTYMGKEQIPVEVSGKTYYGCCAMCKERLAQVAEVRSAVDPVSGKTVDKATAIIGKAEDGAVLYFENAANLDAYNKKLK
jgi:YHS domain-containing protein